MKGIIDLDKLDRMISIYAMQDSIEALKITKILKEVKSLCTPIKTKKKTR